MKIRCQLSDKDYIRVDACSTRVKVSVSEDDCFDSVILTPADTRKLIRELTRALDKADAEGEE